MAGIVSSYESYAPDLPPNFMNPKSSSKEAPDLPRSSTTVSLWDLVGDAPAVTQPLVDIVDDSFYPVEMSCAVPSEIVRLRMPVRHLSQLIAWLHQHVEAQLASAAAWKKRNRNAVLNRQRRARRAASKAAAMPTPESREVRARYMRTYRANLALLKRDMRGEKLTYAERIKVERHKSRLAAKRRKDRIRQWRSDRAAARAMLKAGHIFNPKSS